MKADKEVHPLTVTSVDPKLILAHSSVRKHAAALGAAERQTSKSSQTKLGLHLTLVPETVKSDVIVSILSFFTLCGAVAHS